MSPCSISLLCKLFRCIFLPDIIRILPVYFHLHLLDLDSKYINRWYYPKGLGLAQQDFDCLKLGTHVVFSTEELKRIKPVRVRYKNWSLRRFFDSLTLWSDAQRGAKRNNSEWNGELWSAGYIGILNSA